MATGLDGGRGMPVIENAGYICAANLSIEDIPQKYQGTRVRWRIHPDRSMSGTCEECRDLAGQFMSMEEAVGLQPLHPNCECTLELQPAQAPVGGGELSYRDYSLQARNPDLWNRALEHKRAAFEDGHEH